MTSMQRVPCDNQVFGKPMPIGLGAIVQRTKALLPDHYASLLGERPAGSKWGRDFVEADWALPWAEATDLVDEAARIPGCRYFKLSHSQQWFPDAFVGALPLDEMHEAWLSDVRVRRGVHGLELVCKTYSIEDAEEAWLIVGKHEGQEVVFTVHPGAPLAPLPQKVAVKIGGAA